MKNEKNDFFILYENVKKGNVKMSDLMITDIINIQLMMQNEVDILDNKINKLNDELIELDIEKNALKEDNKICLKKLKNNKN